MARPSERDRYKYGICTNRDKNGEGTPCPKCESKEVQKVRAGQDFVCEECKEPLRMVPSPVILETVSTSNKLHECNKNNEIPNNIDLICFIITSLI